MEIKQILKTSKIIIKKSKNANLDANTTKFGVPIYEISLITRRKLYRRKDREKLLGIHVSYVIFGASRTKLRYLRAAAMMLI